MAAGNITISVSLEYVEVIRLQAILEKIRSAREAMYAENMAKSWMVYNDQQFFELSQEAEKIAAQLSTISTAIRGKMEDEKNVSNYSSNWETFYCGDCDRTWIAPIGRVGPAMCPFCKREVINKNVEEGEADVQEEKKEG